MALAYRYSRSKLWLLVVVVVLGREGVSLIREEIKGGFGLKLHFLFISKHSLISHKLSQKAVNNAKLIVIVMVIHECESQNSIKIKSKEKTIKLKI